MSQHAAPRNALERRQRDIENLRAAVDEHVLRATQEGLEPWAHAQDDVRDRSVEDVALAMLRGLASARDDLDQAVRVLALELDERGTAVTKVAAAAGTDRRTVTRWRATAT